MNKSSNPFGNRAEKFAGYAVNYFSNSFPVENMQKERKDIMKRFSRGQEIFFIITFLNLLLDQ